MLKSEKAKLYDAKAKQLLSRKDVFANILKYAVREFKDCTLDEIIACLDGEPEIGNVPVDDSPELIDAAGSESVSENDGIRSFDIKYKVKLPNSNEQAELIVNLESQNKYHNGYTLEKRGIYYLSRLISSQYNVEFANSNFDDMKKVYSIWICTHAPKALENTITEYSFQPTAIVGNGAVDKKKYDMMSLVMINLGNSDKNYSGLIEMLNLLTNMRRIPVEKAMDILEKNYGVKFKNRLKEVDDMCNLSQGFYDDGKAEGIIEGRAEGRAEGEAKGKMQAKVQMIDNLLAKGFKLSEALELAELDEESYNKFKAEK